MAYSLEELRPSNPVVNFDGRDLELSLITLRIDAKLKEKCDGLSNLFMRVQVRPEFLFEVVWVLLEDKGAFEQSYERFKNSVHASKKTTDQVAKMFTSAINESTLKSIPIIKNSKRLEELRKIQEMASDTVTKVCYGAYYDKIASRYGYKIDEFYNLTLRQLHILLTVSGDKAYEDLEIQAAIAGKKLKPRLKPLDEDMTEDQDNKMDQAAQDMLKEQRRIYQEGKKT